MKWHHIMQKQPEHGQIIVHCEPSYKGHYLMQMREYTQECSFEDLINCNEKNGWPNPNFYWMSAKEFTFPNEKDQLNDM